MKKIIPWLVVLVLIGAIWFLAKPMQLKPSKDLLSPLTNTGSVVETDDNDESALLEPDVALAEYIKDTTLEVTLGKEVFTKHSEKEGYLAITSPTVLKAGDYIKVGAGSEATINWMDDSVTRLADNTEVHITTLSVSSEDPTQTNILFEVFDGEVWNKAMNLVNDKATFAVESGVSGTIAGVRGTTFLFKVDGMNVLIQAIEHAVYLEGEDELDIAEGEQAELSENGAAMNENDSGEVLLHGKFRVRMRALTESDRAGNWFVRNLDLDQKHASKVQNTIQQRMEKNLESFHPDNLRANIEQTTDPKKRMMLSLELANYELQQAVLALSKGQTEQGRTSWVEYQGTVQTIQEQLAGITDEALLYQVKSRLARHAQLWLKYSDLLIADDTELVEGMQQVILNNMDTSRKQRMQKMFDTRRFFRMTDAMKKLKAGAGIQQFSQAYPDLIQKYRSGELSVYECKMLQSLKQRLQWNDADLPPIVCDALRRLNTNSNNTVLLNRNTNGISLKDALSRIESLSCDNYIVAKQLAEIADKKDLFSPGDKVTLQDKIGVKKNMCLTSLQEKVTAAQTEIEGFRAKLAALKPRDLKGPIAKELQGKLDALIVRMRALDAILQSLKTLAF